MYKINRDILSNETASCHSYQVPWLFVIIIGSYNFKLPRPILLRFKDIAMRKLVWRAKTKLKGTSYVLSEFLTRQRQATFAAARKLFGVRSVWTVDGNINIKLPDGKRRRVLSHEDVVNLGAEHGRSLEVPQPSLSLKAGSKSATASSPAHAPSRSRRNAPKK